MQSTAVPILLVSAGILVANRLMGLYGIALAAVGMLSTTGITVAIDAMSELDDSVREITDKLDSVGNTTAAIGKGFAIGSAALTALALFVSYAEAVQLKTIDILNAHVIVGLFMGGMLTFLFSAMTMEMFLPGLMAVLAPIAVGLILGPDALGGLLTGALLTGVLMAIFMSNSGGAWDNAKKYIEEGNHGGKGSTAHKAAVVGDTVGDPFKDTSGPSINILIKLMTIVSLVFAPLFLQFGGLI